MQFWKRKGFIFTLLFIIAFQILILNSYLYYQQFPFPPPEVRNAPEHKEWTFYVHGQISNDDIHNIKKIVEATKGIDHRVIELRKKDDDTVEVKTGEIRAPLDGYGYSLIFEKAQGKWRLIDTSWWIS